MMPDDPYAMPQPAPRHTPIRPPKGSWRRLERAHLEFSEINNEARRRTERLADGARSANHGARPAGVVQW